MRPERRFKPGMDGGLRAASWSPPSHHLSGGQNLSNLWGPPHSLSSDNPEISAKIRTEADYFESNADRMCYPKFRHRHLLVAASSKPAAKPWSAPGSSSPVCSGRFAAPTPSSHCADATSTFALRIIGRPGGQLDSHLCVAHSQLHSPSCVCKGRTALHQYGGSFRAARDAPKRRVSTQGRDGQRDVLDDIKEGHDSLDAPSRRRPNGTGRIN
jgi:hypothetical protein